MEDLCDHGDTGALVEVASSKSPLQPSALAVEGQLAREYEKTNEEDFNDLTCAICLNDIDLPELAMVKGCEHAYCASCILTWAKLKEPHTCPQCKNPFSYLLMYRRLDGTLTDFPEEESVCLLKRAQWLTDRSQVVENIHDTDYRTGSVLEDADWVDYHQFIDEFDEDEEVETYYFKAAAGRTRLVLGNRRWGGNGYVSSGRKQARPARQNGSKMDDRPSKSNEKGGSRDRPLKSGCSPSAHQSLSGPTVPFGSAPTKTLGTPCSSDQPGRRARRNARRAADDARGAVSPFVGLQ
eukprot:jgi/Botrbrau1/10559/Bobra.0343s0008.1